MSIIRSFARPVAISLALAIGAAPLTALAQDPNAPAQHEGKGKGKKGDHDKHFPMKAEAFNRHVEKRIGRALARVNKIIEKKKLPEIVAASIRKDADAGAAKVRAAAAKAGQDGTVTKEEAKVVRDLAKQLKNEARQKYGQGDRSRRGDV